VVLAHLSPARAAAMLKRLAEPARGAALLHMARLTAVAPETIADLREALTAELARAGRRGMERGGARNVAAIVAALGADAGERVLTEMASRAEGTANAVREQLFRFEDLKRMSGPSLGVLLRAVDGADLRLAMRNASDTLRAQLFAAISPRAAAQLEDDLESAPKRRREDIEAAQRRITALAQRLASEGRLDLGTEPDVA
jgi:flagellar motor switch protein FliG